MLSLLHILELGRQELAGMGTEARASRHGTDTTAHCTARRSAGPQHVHLAQHANCHLAQHSMAQHSMAQHSTACETRLT